MKMSPDDKIKKDNAVGLFKNSSTRPVVLLTGGILVGALVLGVMTLGKTVDDVQTGAQVERINPVQHVPGVNSDAEHNDLQRQENERRAAAAKAAGQTDLPTITGDPSVNNPMVIPDITTPVVQQPQVEPPIYNPTGTVQQPQSNPTVEAPPSAPAAASQTITDQITGYLSLWGPRSNEFQEYKYNGTRNVEQQLDPNATAQNASQSSVNTPTSSETSIRYVRAGTMIPAVLITPLNSDSPGPVLAQVSSGPLAGARLMGQMQKNGDSILVAFTQITKPGWPDTYPVSAMGMDLKSSTALASDVNHHYFQRYTAMLAGTYLSGYGQAMGQTGSQTVITDGGIIIDNPTLNTKQIQRSAAGDVLDEIGSEIASKGDRETTVKVQGKNGQPYPIKVLFMSNF